jgi:hypothetical protein
MEPECGSAFVDTLWSAGLMSRPDVEAVIFDLGGVLADFGGVGPMRELAGINSDDEVLATMADLSVGKMV